MVVIAIFIDTRTQRLNRQLRFSDFAFVNQISEQLTTKPDQTNKTIENCKRDRKHGSIQ